MKIDRFIDWSGSPLVVTGIMIALTFYTLRGVSLLGLFVTLLGTTLYGISNFTMGRCWSVKVESKPRVVDEGIYGYIRHPIYLSVLIASFGLSWAFFSAPSFVYNVFISLPFYYYRSLREEIVLSKNLKGYKNYMKRTGRFFPKL